VAPETLVVLSGSGAGNTLVLFGSQALNGTERYGASTAAVGGVGDVGAGNVLFTFTNAVPSVTDDLTATPLVVEAPGQFARVDYADRQLLPRLRRLSAPLWKAAP
jgi:hypothetical protein